MGRFLPHPDDVPVELTLRKYACISRQRLHTISLGGMACNYHRAWRYGTALEVHMPSLGENARYNGYVAWCLKRKRGYLVGIAFVDEQTLFSARMGEQVCQIARYCRLREPLSEQRCIEALALDWVERHAKDYSEDRVHQAFVQP
ncbi:PilZ domain-containing protein [Pseudomonas chlororaphis]|uniref:PilZ domain-containing protein n=1 Tax=Pseudomonas chlororaphis TaxID=587753 RepID=UPI00209B220F|nr:PilZ domain-containing protein [Pseudomonas chlororaphis]MCO7612309.1 PilZ domain-containing protein [Pseudomonas chlororaphis]